MVHFHVMAFASRPADDAIFKPKEISASGITILCDAIKQSALNSSYEWNIEQGNEPKWFVDEFTTREGNSNVKSKKVGGSNYNV